MRREYYLHTRKNGIFYVEFVCPESGAKMTARSTGEKDEIKARVKAERLDVNCRIDDGTQVDLEMQDRLVKALRLEGISTIEKANRYLLETYLPKMNEQFSRPARDKDDAHVSPGKAKLDDILCMEFDRVISKDYIVRFQTRLFQIEKNKPLPRTRDKVIVRIKLDNSVHIIWKNKPLAVKEIPTMFDE